MARRLALLLALIVLAPRPLPAADAPQPPADPAPPQPIAKLPGPAGTDVAFSRDGKLILTTGGDAARVWDAETFKPVGVPIRHDGMFAVRISDRWDVLLSIGDDGARLWDVRSGKPLGAQLAPQGEYDGWATAVSADGSLVALGSTTGAGASAWDVEVWQTEPRRCRHSLPHRNTPDFALFSPDGRRLLTGEVIFHGWYSGEEVFHFWDMLTGTELRPPISVDYNYLASDGPAAAFSPDGKRFALVNLDGFALYDAATGDQIAKNTPPPRRRTPTPHLRSVSFSADGRRILAQGAGMIEVWDTSTMAQIDAGLTGWKAAINADGTRVVAVLDTHDENHPLAVCHVATGEVLLVLTRARVDAVAFSPDGRRVAAGFASDGFTGVWEVPEREGP